MPVAFAQVLQAEWTKLRSVRSTAAALAAALVLTVLFTLLTATGNEISCEPGPCPPTDPREDTVLLSLSGVYIGMLGVAVLGVLAICSEYATGTIRSTLTAMPRRPPVLAGKALVVAALSLAVAVPASIACFYLGSEILSGNGFSEFNGYPAASLSDSDSLRAVLGAAVFLVLVALLSLGIGAIVRHAAGAITIVLGLAFMPLILIGIVGGDTGELIEKATPITAGLAVLKTVDAADAPIGPIAGLAVLAAYTAGTLLVGGWLLARRDA